MNIFKLMINFYYDSKYGKITHSALRKNKMIYIGKRHSDIFLQAPMGELRNAEQGFLTENHKFVNRKVGLKIAKHYNQIINKTPPKDVLFSEDMW